MLQQLFQALATRLGSYHLCGPRAFVFKLMLNNVFGCHSALDTMQKLIFLPVFLSLQLYPSREKAHTSETVFTVKRTGGMKKPHAHVLRVDGDDVTRGRVQNNCNSEQSTRKEVCKKNNSKAIYFCAIRTLQTHPNSGRELLCNLEETLTKQCTKVFKKLNAHPKSLTLILPKH